MMGNYIVGALFAIIIYVAAKKGLSDIKKGKCSGCSCSESKKPVQIKF